MDISFNRYSSSTLFSGRYHPDSQVKESHESNKTVVKPVR